MREFVFAPSARDDLRDILDYLKTTAGNEVAISVVSRIRDTCLLLAGTSGTLGAMREEILPGLRSLPVPPHVLFFRYSDAAVEIIRILHGRRDIDRSFEE